MVSITTILHTCKQPSGVGCKHQWDGPHQLCRHLPVIHQVECNIAVENRNLHGKYQAAALIANVMHLCSCIHLPVEMQVEGNSTAQNGHLHTKQPVGGSVHGMQNTFSNGDHAKQGAQTSD